MKKCVYLVFLILLTALPCRADEYLNPKLKEVPVAAVVILPPRVELVEHGMKGSESMMKEAEGAAAKLASAVALLLRQKGVMVNDELLKPAAVDGDLRMEVSRLQKQFDTVSPKIVKKRKDIRKGSVTMGDEVAAFPLAASTNAILFIRGSGFHVTKSRALALGGTGLFGGTQLTYTLTLVDSRSGEVLFLTSSHCRIREQDTVEDYRKDVDGPLDHFPAPKKPVS